MHRRLLQRAQGIVAVLRRLDRDQILDALLQVQPVARRDLAARAERDQRVVRYITLRQPLLAGLGAVDVEPDLLLSDDLRQVHVDGPADARDLVADLQGDGVVRLVVHCRSDNLHVDWGAHPEVQHLVGDVRREEEDGRPGQLEGQPAAQLLHVLRGRVVLLLELDHHLAVGRRDHRRVADREVDAAHRQADVVDDRLQLVLGDHSPDDGLRLDEHLLGRLEARPRPHPDMEADLPGVDRREEVAAEVRAEQGERQGDEGAEAQGHQLAVIERPVEVAAIGAAHALEVDVEPLVQAPDEVALAQAVAA